MSRMLLGVSVLFIGCGSSLSADGVVDAGPALGTPGANVWFDSSDSIQVTYAWATTFPGSSGSGAECVRLTRAELSAEQSTYLDTLTLDPFRKAWCADGYSYVEVRVNETNGASAIYRDTGCEGQAIADAGVMLPQGVWSHFQNTGASCQ
jgi:hypothetical protein